MKKRWRAGEGGERVRDCSHVFNGPAVICILAVCTGSLYSRSGEGRVGREKRILGGAGERMATRTPELERGGLVGRREYWGSRGERMAIRTPDLEWGGG